ncbi:MAG: [Eubacterium sp.]|nr:[FeFe] hydrogenase H-cluster maturation GTPase HydF [Eubacterium sp.]
PNWIRNYTGKNVEFRFTSGGTFPTDFADIKMIVHCGGCMLNEKEMQSRAAEAQAAGVPMTNYGIAIAQMHGILDRSIELFD